MLDQEWVTDAPATRGEKQWERYTNNNADHIDWSPKTNEHEARGPYIGGAGLVQVSEDPKADDKKASVSRPAGPVRGEKQW